MDTVEVYVLCESRSKVTAMAFLDAFLPDRKSSSEEFPFPEFSDSPQNVYFSAGEVMSRLEHEPSQSYSLHWGSTGSRKVSQAMIFFTRDGAMIAGLVVSNLEADETLVKIARIVEGQFGFLTTENPPPETCTEFIDLCRESTLTALVDGCLRKGSAEC